MNRSSAHRRNTPQDHPPAGPKAGRSRMCHPQTVETGHGPFTPPKRGTTPQGGGQPQRLLTGLLAFLLGATLAAQQPPTQSPANQKHSHRAHPGTGSTTGASVPHTATNNLHRPDATYPPTEALDLLLEGHGTRLAHLHQLTPLPELPAHPSGSGPYLAAVWTGVAPSLPMHRLFHRRPEELLEFRSPGPVVRLLEVAAIERAVVHHRLSLLVILVPDPEPLFKPLPEGSPAANTPASQRVEHSLATSRARAVAEQLPVPVAHGLLQRRHLFASSPLLQMWRNAGRFEVAVGVLKGGSLEIEWHAAWRHAWPMAANAGVYVPLPELQPLLPAQPTFGSQAPLNTRPPVRPMGGRAFPPPPPPLWLLRN